LTTSDAASGASQVIAATDSSAGRSIDHAGVAASSAPRIWLKRACDITVSAIAAPFVLVVSALIGICVFISSPGNPFFVQRRVGRGGATFRCVKFRTMYPGAAERLHTDPELFAAYIANDFKIDTHDDPRVFWFGRLLRRTSLDELPQLVNVILGHMSLVGPRPIVPDELAMYEQWQYAYLAMRPGITGAWQINGRNHVRYPERAMLDAEYFEHWAFWTDILILVKTIPSVISRHGTH
jgi:lipopolysaccharide/colanic/teichoic acid biosynthesis glycosyltransferase